MTTAETDQDARNRKARLVRRLYEEAYCKGEYEVIEELIAPEYDANDGKEFEREPNGPERVRAHIEWQRTAFPDVQLDVRDVYVDGDTAVAHLRFTGTHDGPFVVGPGDDPFVAEPTGTVFEMGGMRSFRFEDGVVVESHMYSEPLDMVLELGIAGEFAEYVASRENAE